MNAIKNQNTKDFDHPANFLPSESIIGGSLSDLASIAASMKFTGFYPGADVDYGYDEYLGDEDGEYWDEEKSENSKKFYDGNSRVDVFFDLMRGDNFAIKQVDIAHDPNRVGGDYIFDNVLATTALVEGIIPLVKYLIPGYIILAVDIGQIPYERNELCGTNLLALPTSSGLNLNDVETLPSLHKFISDHNNDIAAGDLNMNGLFSDKYPAFIGVKKESLSEPCSEMDLTMLAPYVSEEIIFGAKKHLMMIQNRDLDHDIIFTYKDQVVGKYFLYNNNLLGMPGAAGAYSSIIPGDIWKVTNDFMDNTQKLFDKVHHELPDVPFTGGQSITEDNQIGFFGNNAEVILGLSSCAMGFVGGIIGKTIWNNMLSPYSSQVDVDN